MRNPVAEYCANPAAEPEREFLGFVDEAEVYRTHTSTGDYYSIEWVGDRAAYWLIVNRDRGTWTLYRSDLRLPRGIRPAVASGTIEGGRLVQTLGRMIPRSVRLDVDRLYARSLGGQPAPEVLANPASGHRRP